ncbi:GNAT family N-acetyltransferase [Mesorhizobium sp.]|uniref:GNAT family N-acetyltransferase n=1 Tax=Mesorhizobium sp. TaxID=1871066 RepID=UPI00257CB193|nr:GNAT family N-acetyltransferase [Mesorhizobium sp.]
MDHIVMLDRRQEAALQAIAQKLIAQHKGDAVKALKEMGESWRRTYSPIMGAETAALISDEDHTLQRIAAELTDTNKMSFVAERPDGSIAGYAMAKMNEAGDVMLDRLHIDQSEYGTGLAANILHAVFAAHSRILSIALEVLEGNDRAMAFYRKHGSKWPRCTVQKAMHR